MDKFVSLVESLILEKENFFKPNKKDANDLSVFVSKRSKGAEKIQKTAKDKGGFSLLTAVHFEAKKIPYNVCKKHLNDDDSCFIKEKADECFDKLKKWDKMSQKEFQHVMGQLEAYGEVYIRSVQNKGK
jgi:hypothetical protein